MTTLGDNPRRSRVLWLTKRRYMGKDLVDDRYGRYWRLPWELACSGLDVHLMVISYQGEPAVEQDLGNGLTLTGVDIRRPHRILSRLWRRFRSRPPDVIVASSDSPFCVLGGWLSRLTGTPLICDVYDNFETYASARIPGMIRAYLRALTVADRVVVFEQLLLEYLRGATGTDNFVLIPNAVDRLLFHERERDACRDGLGLPLAVPVVAYIGAIARGRGIETVLRAWEQVRAQRPEAILLLAGRRDAGVDLAGDGVRDLGIVSHEEVPVLIGAADLGLVSYRDDDFGRYSFPVKAQELLACGRRVLAPRIGGIVPFLRHRPDCLYVPGDARDLARRCLSLLASPVGELPKVATWGESARAYRELIDDLSPRGGGGS